MKSIEPDELSGLIDGELDPVRATEVRNALRRDADLRRQFETLSKADEVWLLAGRSATFTPKMPLKLRFDSSTLGGLGAVSALLAVRLLPKFFGTLEWAILWHGLAFVCALIWIVAMTRDGEQREFA